MAADHGVFFVEGDGVLGVEQIGGAHAGNAGTNNCNARHSDPVINLKLYRKPENYNLV